MTTFPLEKLSDYKLETVFLDMWIHFLNFFWNIWCYYIKVFVFWFSEIVWFLTSFLLLFILFPGLSLCPKDSLSDWALDFICEMLPFVVCWVAYTYSYLVLEDSSIQYFFPWQRNVLQRRVWLKINFFHSTVVVTS